MDRQPATRPAGGVSPHKARNLGLIWRYDTHSRPGAEKRI